MMLLKIFISILFFEAANYYSNTSAADSFYPVIYVNGRIINSETQKPIMAGDDLSSTYPLYFDSDTSYLLIVNSEQVVKLSKNYSKIEPYKFSCTKLISDIKEIDSFYLEQQVYSQDFIQFFSTRQSSIIDKTNYQFSDNNFLIIQFINRNSLITRKLSFLGNTILMNKPSHFKNDSIVRVTQIKVLQYNSLQNRYYEVYTYLPYQKSSTEIRQLLDPIKKVIKDKFPKRNDLVDKLQQEALIEILGICPGYELKN